MNHCKARNCHTYIGEVQDFCRKHWDLIPSPNQRALRKAYEARQQGTPNADVELRRNIAEAVDAIANKEREAQLQREAR